MSDAYLRSLRQRALGGDPTALDVWEREMFRLGTPAPKGTILTSFRMSNLQREMWSQNYENFALKIEVPRIVLMRLDFAPLSADPFDVSLETSPTESLVRLRRCFA